MQRRCKPRRNRCGILRAFTLLSSIVVANVLGTVVAEACSCVGREGNAYFHPCAVDAASNAVFVGTVLGIAYTPVPAAGTRTEYHETTVRVSVDESFRGDGGPTLELVSSLCGYPFQLGGRYPGLRGTRFHGQVRNLCVAALSVWPMPGPISRIFAPERVAIRAPGYMAASCRAFSATH